VIFELTLRLATHARSHNRVPANNLCPSAAMLGGAISTEIGQVPKSFPKISSTAAGSQRAFGLLIVCKKIVAGAPGLNLGPAD
jgi:hypothetical protein